MDKNLFLKNMEEMIQIAKTNGNQIDHKELLDYFSDYELNEEAKKLLVASFVEAGIRVLGVDEAQIVAEEEAKEKADISEEEQGAIRFYEEELEQMDLPGEEEQKELIHAWLVEKGDGEAVIESFLPQILEIARTHTGKGVLFIIIENRNKRSRRRPMNDLSRLSYGMALGIGVFQILALIPGTSRSGATILGGILLGCSRTVAAEFSFFLGIPVMFGASLLKIVKFGLAFTSTQLIVLIVGMVVSFLVSIGAIKFLLGYIKKNDFKAFGVYRIILGLLVIVYFAFIK